MSFLIIHTYDNYVEAHIAKGVLEEEGINCWLKDENTVTISPMLSNAVGGIKLMINTEEIETARGILNKLREEQKEKIVCTKCSSHNVELVSTPRDPINWLSSILGYLMGSYSIGVEKVNHCFDCKHEFPYK